MDTTCITNLIEVLTLIFAIITFAYSTHHANKVMKQTKGISQNAYQHFLNASFNELYLKYLVTLPEETLGGKTDFSNKKIQKHMQIYFDMCYEAFRLHQEQLISDNMWKIWEERIKQTMQFENYKQYWTILAQQYPEDFWHYINMLTNNQQ